MSQARGAGGRPAGAALRVDGIIEAIAASGCGLTAGGAAWDGARLADATGRMADELRRLGVRPGALIGWASPGGAGSASSAGAGGQAGIAAELACLMLGAAAAPLPHDTLASPPLRLDHRIELLADAGGGVSIRDVSAENVGAQDVDAQNDAENVDAQNVSAENTGAENTGADSSRLPAAPAGHSAIGPDSLVGAKFTSGTTGPRKAVGVTAAHLEHTWAGLDSVFGIGADDVVLAPLEPHVWLQRTLVLLALARGAQVVLAPDPRRLVSALRSARPTVVFAVPSVLAAVLEAARRTGRPLAQLWGGRLRSLGTGSAPCPAEVIAAYQQADVPVHEGYGTSETGMIAKNGPGRHRVGTVGPAFPGVTLELLDGAVRVRCAALPRQRYLDGSPIAGRESATTHLTRDLGLLDDDGYLRLLGRADDVITLPSGRKVHPQLLEEQLRTVPGVADCAVFADERQQLRAAVVPAPGTTAAQVCQALRARGAGVPVDAWPAPAVLSAEARLPRTAQGKLVRRELALLAVDGSA